MSNTKTRRTATLPDGRTTSRLTAAESAYVVVTRLSYAHALERASQLYEIEGAIYRDHCAEINGTSVWHNKPPHRSEEEHTEYVADRVAYSTKAIKGIASALDYQKRNAAKRIAHVEMRKAQGLYDRWFTKSWFSSMEQARKAADAALKPRLAEVRIVHTDPTGDPA
jgi:hypothetical protein